MAVIQTKQIRNVALLGHSGSGKTTLAEAVLFLTKKIDRMGKTTDGNTTCDYDAEEKARGFSLTTAMAPVMWNDIKINFFDTPGFLDFVGEVKQAVRVADAATIVVDAKSGVEVGTELAWGFAEEVGIPKSFFVNKCDDNDADFDRVFTQLHETFGTSVCPISVPCDDAMINLVEMKAFQFDAKGVRSEIPMTGKFEEIAARYKEAFNDAISMVSEEIMEKVLMEEEISKEEIAEAIHEGILKGDITPVMSGSATSLSGLQSFLDTIANSFPRHTAKKQEQAADGSKIDIDPNGEPALFVFKTIADPFVGKMSFFKVMNGSAKRDMSLRNVQTDTVEKLAHIYVMRGAKQEEVEELACGDIGMVAKLANTFTNNTLSNSGVSYAPTLYPNPYMTQAMMPATAKDESKISQAIARMLEEDQTLKYENNPETKQMLISGIGDMHLAVMASRLKSRFGVSIRLETPKIPYREKITKKCDVEGKHKKQNGGSGQYGHVKIRFMPGDEEGLTFVDATVGGSVPKNFIPAVEKGLVDAMQKGVAGFPMVGLKAELYDGSYHAVDSDEVSFKTAANLAYKKCLELSAPVLLEPVGDLYVTAPESMVGDVMGDLNKRRGSVMGMNPDEHKKGYTVIQATVPKSEIADYPITLRAMSQGRASFEFTVTGYDVVPGNISAKIVEAYKKSQSEG